MISKSKYKNKKTYRIVNGHFVQFDSIKEAKEYDYLLIRAKNGDIKNLTIQPKFKIIDRVQHLGKTLRAIHYIADFKYEENGETYVVDTKGYKTDLYMIKKRLFLIQYPDFIFIEK